MGILDTIREQVNSMTEDQVREQLAKIQEHKAKQAENRKEKGPLTAEQLEKRKEYNRARIQKPEVKEKMKAYRTRPEVKERMKEYRVKRQEKIKAIVARAKELGLAE
jgi:hypothetical protein